MSVFLIIDTTEFLAALVRPKLVASRRRKTTRIGIAKKSAMQVARRGDQ
jgi:hypothetical protein